MNLKTACQLAGRHWFTAYEQHGRVWRPVYRSPVMHNLILTVGKQATLDRLAGLGGVASFINVGVGTDSTAVAAGQTQLNPSVAGSVVIQACIGGFPSRTSTSLIYQSQFALATANFQWNEAAIFNGTSNGTSLMYNRVVFGAPFTKASNFAVIYAVQFTQG